MLTLHFFFLSFIINSKIEPRIISWPKTVIMKGYATISEDTIKLSEEQLKNGRFNDLDSIIIDLYLLTYVQRVYITMHSRNDPVIDVHGVYYGYLESPTSSCDIVDSFPSLKSYECNKIFRSLQLTGEIIRYEYLDISGYSAFMSEYVGCFKVVGEQSPYINSDNCEKECLHPYIGFNEDNKCFCGPSLKYMLPDILSNCASYCANVETLRCGTGSSLAIYSTSKEIIYAQRRVDCFLTKCQTCSGTIPSGQNCEIFVCGNAVDVCVGFFECQNESVKNITVSICQCKVGYYRKNWIECIDIDECVRGITPCDKRTGNCINSIGTYKCQCFRGFKRSDENWTSCLDIDECDPMSNPCDFNSSSCENSFGSFTCRCLSGYFTQPDVPNICIDIDECLTDTCKHSRACVNIIGSFHCDCNPGFQFSTLEKNCKDIDECWLDNLCENETTQCINKPGSYVCECNVGFSRLTSLKCADNDECTSLINTCSENSLCINNFGSYTCECPEGSITRIFAYSTECQDIDECVTTSHGCDLEVSLCLNLIFGYYCQCRIGYTNVNNNSCEPIYTNNATTYQEEFTMITTEHSDINSFSALYVILLTILGLVVLAVSTFVFYKIVIWCGRAKSLGSSISSFQESVIEY